MNLPPTIFIKDIDFHSAWSRAIRVAVLRGIPIVIGSEEEPKPIRDICGMFELTGNAIRQIEDRELHPQFPFRHIEPYCEEFTREYQKEYELKEESEKFTYTYFDRLTNYFNIDQLKYMNIDLAHQKGDGISSNRNQSITWDPNEDIDNSASPCLQNIWIRYIGNDQVEVHWHFRSRDLFSAWQANIIALVDMLNREVIHPNNCKIVKIIDYSDSLHIYESDLFAANNVDAVKLNPMDRR